MHSASLIKEIKSVIPEVSFAGIGGPEMKKENVSLLYDISQVNFMGFSSVLKNIKKIKAILAHCISEIKKANPDLIILVDYPGFNLRLAEQVRKFYKGKIFFYISPQLWAWHKSRVKIIQKFIDLMIVVFPFEVDFYKKENVKAIYAGHPLIKKIDDFLKANKKVKSDKLQISLLPGSRKDEISRMLPVMMKAAARFADEFDCEINILCSTNFEKSFYEKFMKGKKFNLIYDDEDSNLNYRTILNSDLAVTKSGTSTVECALIGTPFCVIYKAGIVNYAIGRLLVNVKHIAMVNILLDKTAVREFLQNKVTAENIFEEGKKILTDKVYRSRIENDFKTLRAVLTDKDASKNAAALISDFLNQH